MKKRIVTIIMLVALVAGLLGGNMPAASATVQQGTFCVGYSKQYVNPWVKSAYTGGLGIADITYTDSHIMDVKLTDTVQKMVSVPLAGYSSSLNRLSNTMADDNSDGKIGLGDGLFTTCTVVTNQEDATILFVTLDAIGAMDQLVMAIKNEIPAAIKKVAATENTTKKILVLGNSHGVDSSTMLAKIYAAENPNRKVQLGRIYYSGCRLDQHVDYLTNNKGQYIYYRTNANGAWERSPMSAK